MESISGEFVNSLKRKLEKERAEKNYNQNLLKDSFRFIIETLVKKENIFLNSRKDFETNELSLLANFDCNFFDPLDQILKIFQSEGIIKTSHQIDPRISLFLLDLTDKVEGFRAKKNLIILQLRLKTKDSVEIKAFLKMRFVHFFPYEKNFYNLKFWLCSGEKFHSTQVEIKKADREKNCVKYDIDNSHFLRIDFYQNGEIKNMKISKKREKKNNLQLQP